MGLNLDKLQWLQSNLPSFAEPIKCVNKGSQKEKPEQLDKITFTPRIPQKDREIATEPVYTLNFGQSFRTPSKSFNFFILFATKFE